MAQGCALATPRQADNRLSGIEGIMQMQEAAHYSVNSGQSCQQVLQPAAPQCIHPPHFVSGSQRTCSEMGTGKGRKRWALPKRDRSCGKFPRFIESDS